MSASGEKVNGKKKAVKKGKAEKAPKKAKKAGKVAKARVVRGKAKKEKAVKKKVKEGNGKVAGKKAAKKEKRKKTPERKSMEKLRAKIGKKPRPKFEGRFGKRSTRKKSKAKWQRWRVPRGIDIKRKREHGLRPKTGYRTPKDIRELHPSGQRVVLVHNTRELEAVGQESAIRIGSTVGGLKRTAIAKEAAKKGLRVVNAG